MWPPEAQGSRAPPASHDFSLASALPRCEIPFYKDRTVSMGHPSCGKGIRPSLLSPSQHRFHRCGTERPHPSLCTGLSTYAQQIMAHLDGHGKTRDLHTEDRRPSCWHDGPVTSALEQNWLFVGPGAVRKSTDCGGTLVFVSGEHIVETFMAKCFEEVFSGGRS